MPHAPQAVTPCFAQPKVAADKADHLIVAAARTVRIALALI